MEFTARITSHERILEHFERLDTRTVISRTLLQRLLMPSTTRKVSSTDGLSHINLGIGLDLYNFAVSDKLQTHSAWNGGLRLQIEGKLQRKRGRKKASYLNIIHLRQIKRTYLQTAHLKLSEKHYFNT